jgi:transposase
MSDLAVLDPRAAFVDVGSEKMHVSIAGGPPAVFGTVTSQLHALRNYLAEHQVRSVAMEATGVYWLPLYGILEAAGLEVVMVDGRQTRNLPGRASRRMAASELSATEADRRRRAISSTSRRPCSRQPGPSRRALRVLCR